MFVDTPCPELMKYYKIVIQGNHVLGCIERSVAQEATTSVQVIYASAQILLSYLQTVIRDIIRRSIPVRKRSQIEAPVPLAWPSHRLQPTVTGRILRDTMLAKGWCPHQTRKILREFPYHVVNCFTMLPRHTPNVSHKNCSLESCQGWTLTASQTALLPNHSIETCNCSVLTVDSTKVAQIIRNGELPLVRIHTDLRGKISLRLCKKKR